ncbi:MAG: hypothetical protein P4L46_12830 [Fimbriimonas sp.]|nr:hypothetical protein [Fimbriimonas sp.]
MDAKTFVSQKHDEAIEELKALEAEYIPRRDAAQSKINLAKKWLDELSLDKEEIPVAVAPAQAPSSVADLTKTPANNWVSARDLNPQARLNSP